MPAVLHTPVVAAHAPDDALDALAAFNKAAGDPLRLTILRVLRRASYSVMELCAILAIKQSALSHHLKVLVQAGLLASRREGTTLFYRRTESLHHDRLGALQRQLLAAVDALALDAALDARLQAVQQERSALSRRFFRDNAGRFRQQQELVASLAQYAGVLTDALDSLPLAARGHAIEVGPGDGHFLHALAGRFAKVSAVDNSPEMLARSQERCAAEGLASVTCRLGEPGQLRLAAADCVVVNMVLHHVASPAELLADCAALLAPGGWLLVSELCPHEQHWAREACGDLWLGIDPDDLSAWAAEAGLTEGQNIFLALRNGFRVQIRSFQQPTLTTPTDIRTRA